MTTFVTVRCSNPLCPTQQRKVVGELPPGGIGRLKCHDCGVIAVYRVPMFAGMIVDTAEMSR